MTTQDPVASVAARAAALRQRAVAPSILSADLSRLGAQVQAVLDAGARVIHVDVMDGQFVPPITFGPVVVQALCELVHDRGAVLDVHLMIAAPERQVEAIAAAGADSITFHYEATPHVHYTLQAIRAAGCAAALAICPATPATVVADVAADGMLDMVLCMSVNPGWGNQTLIPHSFARLQQLRAMLPETVALEVDGGVNPATAAACARAGANLLVAGSAVFGTAEPGPRLQALQRAAWS